MEENPEDENSPIECSGRVIDPLIHDKKCDNISENKEELSNHMKQTHGINCDDCWGQTKTESDMKEHMKLFHQQVCLNCDRLHGGFKEIYCLNCSSDIEEKYPDLGKKCEECKTIAANDKDLKYHEKLKHSKCEVCLMYFKGKTELKIHTVTPNKTLLGPSPSFSITQSQSASGIFIFDQTKSQKCFYLTLK